MNNHFGHNSFLKDTGVEINKVAAVVLVLVGLFLVQCRSEDSSENPGEPEPNEAINDTTLQVSNYMYGEYGSSTKLTISWTTSGKVSKIVYSEVAPGQGPTHELAIDNSITSIVLANLKSSTTYQVDIQSCDSTCISKAVASGTTEEEYWQVQGQSTCTGNQACVDSATIVLEDSATAAYAIKYPSENKTTLYTNKKPLSSSGPMKAFAQNSGGTELSDFLSFEWVDGPYIHTCDRHQEDCSDVEINMATYQIVPLANEEATLLVFEGMTFEERTLPDGETGFKQTTQLYQMKSYDGYTGLDFNYDENSAICDFDDLRQGASCNYELLLSADDESGLKQVRQTKIAYPVLEDIYWKENLGTFMAITGQDNCGQTDDGIFMGILSDTGWETVKEDGCPRPLFTHGHGPIVVHMGQNQYKLYAETYELEPGESYSITEVTKPLQLIYADGSLTDSSNVEISDFEDESLAREVNFLWANGQPVSPAYESGFGDHMIFLPTSNLNHQIMFLNLNGFDNTDVPNGSPGIGVAVLLNP